MIRWFANRKVLIFLFGILFFIAVMGLTISNRAQMTWPEQFFKDTVGWFQGVVNVPARVVGDWFGEWQQISNVHEENEALRKQLDQFARNSARLNQLEADNVRLQRALDFTESQRALHNYKFHYADVISISGNEYNPSLLINLGSKDGIKLDMAVTSVEGLVGRISAVTQYHSTVQLLHELDENNRTSRPMAATVRGAEGKSFGIIEEFDRSKGLLVMTKIDPLDPLKKGDVVVTSGLGQLFPSGLVIGTVKSRKIGDFGITHVAEIQPAATLTKLREVFVVEVPVAESR